MQMKLRKMAVQRPILWWKRQELQSAPAEHGVRSVQNGPARLLKA